MAGGEWPLMQSVFGEGNGGGDAGYRREKERRQSSVCFHMEEVARGARPVTRDQNFVRRRRSAQRRQRKRA
jgi:hypothetical protein